LRPPAPILAATGLSARYGHVQALHPLDIRIGEGELVAVLGPNGAGKSTLLRALMGLVSNAGEVRFRDTPLPRQDVVAVASRGIVLVPEGRGIFGPMSVADNLELGAYRLRDKSEFARRRERVLTLFPRLKERLGQMAGSMSGGEQQMLAIGRA
jgi:branched-chain amino acid transport system ATP-binding protein